MRLKQLNDRTLADKTGLSHTTIYRLRHGDRPYCHLDRATAIAEALDVEVDALFRLAGQDSPSQPTN